MIIRCVFVSGRRRRRRRRRKGTYIQPPEGWASSPTEGGFMGSGGCWGYDFFFFFLVFRGAELAPEVGTVC